MLAIYETIEKSLSTQPPANLATDFEDLFRKELQRPVLLSPPTADEQVNLLISFIFVLFIF